MSQTEFQADNMQKILNNVWGRRAHVGVEKEVLFQAVGDEMRADAPEFLERRMVLVPLVDGDKTDTAEAEVLFARYGEGVKAAWVTFLFFHDGNWAVARRPLTADTKTMPWLDDYVVKEFTGSDR